MTGSDEPRLVLWDIDHTLLSFDGVGRDSYAAALDRATGRAWDMQFSFGGITELAMARKVLAHHGVDPEPELIATLFGYLDEEHQLRADHMARTGKLLPGASQAVEALASAEGTRQSVLTGNLRTIAELKLRLFGLDRWLDVPIGAYGDEETERAALVPLAWHNVEVQYGDVYPAWRTVLVGDTGRDVEAALAHGAGIVAVASGLTSAADLAEAGAVVVLDDLADIAGLLSAIRQASEVAASR